MASYFLVNVSDSLEKTSNQISHRETRVALAHPVIEHSSDRLGTLYTYRIEFKTYMELDAHIDLDFYPQFNQQLQEYHYGR